MIDRFGNNIMVAYSEMELEWLIAAMALPIDERDAALTDIAAMSGRTFKEVSRKAAVMRQKVKDQERQWAREVLVPVFTRRHGAKVA
jgi:hypothetical protein